MDAQKALPPGRAFYALALTFLSDGALTLLLSHAALERI
jgi:hypothetical protein